MPKKYALAYDEALHSAIVARLETRLCQWPNSTAREILEMIDVYILDKKRKAKEACCEPC